MVGALVGSVVGGAIGAAIWAAVGFYTGYEVGWIAWGVGALAGLGAALGSNVMGSGPSTGSGIIAAVVALAAVAVGKVTVLELHVQNDPDLAMASEFTDEILLSYVALQVAEHWEDEGVYIDWPEIPENQWYRWREDQFPAGLWEETEMWWDEQTREHQNDAREGFRQQFETDVREIEDIYGDLGSENFLTIFDAIWILLAVGSAFGLGQGGSDE